MALTPCGGRVTCHHSAFPRPAVLLTASLPRGDPPRLAPPARCPASCREPPPSAPWVPLARCPQRPPRSPAVSLCVPGPSPQQAGRGGAHSGRAGFAPVSCLSDSQCSGQLPSQPVISGAPSPPMAAATGAPSALPAPHPAPGSLKRKEGAVERECVFPLKESFERIFKGFLVYVFILH